MLKGNSGRLPVFTKHLLEGPNDLSELEKRYFHAADILAEPGNDFDPTDIGRVITLRPNVALTFQPARVDEHKHGGYFAYGEREGETIRFGIFCPHSSVRPTFPPKELKTAVNLFAVELGQNGYALPQNPIRYSIHI